MEENGKVESDTELNSIASGQILSREIGLLVMLVRAIT
jgi:hypothetical protein